MQGSVLNGKYCTNITSKGVKKYFYLVFGSPKVCNNGGLYFRLGKDEREREREGLVQELSLVRYGCRRNNDGLREDIWLLLLVVDNTGTTVRVDDGGPDR